MYAIAGVTGNTGRVAAETLLARGEKVRVVVRDPAKGQAFADKGAEVAVADLSDAAALTNALRGAKGAYVLVPPNFVVTDFAAYQDGISDAIAQAVAAAKVPHVVLLSSVGADVPAGTGPIAGLYRAEAKLSNIPGTVATFIRAGYFVENLGGSLGALAHGILPTFFAADFPVTMIATQDIGELAATLLLEGASQTSAVQLGGTATGGTTYEDVADAIGRITGKRPQVVVNPVSAMSDALQGFGVPKTMADLYQEMTTAMLNGTITHQPGLRTIPMKTSVETVLRGLLSA